jgi:hypothetical protein
MASVSEDAVMNVIVSGIAIEPSRWPDADAVAAFESLERGFATQSRWTTLLVGLTGLYLVERGDLWQRFADLRYWWMYAMVLVWALFTLMLFVLEPLFLHRWLAARRDAGGTLRRIAVLHRRLLAASFLTIVGAVAGSHGWHWFG